jgi:hypothetical protein
MNAYEYIVSKQIQWASNHGIPLIGSKGIRGRPTYTKNLDQNLFAPLDLSVRISFDQGDGHEIIDDLNSPAKMQAVHSSSALSVNIFQYWLSINRLSEIAAACGLCRKGTATFESIKFEDKYPIDNRFILSPNIDVVFHNSDSSRFKRFAIECKFSEAYSPLGHSGLKPKYLGLTTAWSDIPRLFKFANSICPTASKYKYLHPAQLIKHILGLKAECGKYGFRLLYLWYDVIGKEGAIHREEIERFSEEAKADGIYFASMSYQELIILLANDYRQEHADYIKYITERYL